MITAYYEISYFGFNFHRKSTSCLSPFSILKVVFHQPCFLDVTEHLPMYYRLVSNLFGFNLSLQTYTFIFYENLNVAHREVSLDIHTHQPSDQSKLEFPSFKIFEAEC